MIIEINDYPQKKAALDFSKAAFFFQNRSD